MKELFKTTEALSFCVTSGTKNRVRMTTMKIQQALAV